MSVGHGDGRSEGVPFSACVGTGCCWSSQSRGHLRVHPNCIRLTVGLGKVALGARHFVVVLSTVILLFLVDQGVAADKKTISDNVRLFEEKIGPLLTDVCLKCHGGEEKIKGGLLLTSYANLVAGGDSGPVIDLDNLGNSLLLKMISYSDDQHQMPPKTKLSQERIDLLTSWVNQGAPWGRKDLGPVSAAGKSLVTRPAVENKGGGAWAYRKASRPSVPVTKNATWARNPIDQYILAGLEAKGLKPAPEANRRVLIRRATYDLLGLPPSRKDVEDFVKDPDPLAYDKLIERLLTNPHYGEKWGRHWLDLVGYAETNGFERDGDKPFAWRYRDYVIRALNEDKPYDQFLIEQLAGDLLDKPTADSIVATGYLRLGQWDDEPADRELAHYNYLDGIVGTTSQAMLGMSLNCARCHNHKKDPLTQEDYYRMIAFFNGMKPMAVNGPDIEVAISGSGSRQVLQARSAKLQEQQAKTEADFNKRDKGDKGETISAAISAAMSARGAEVLGKEAYSRYVDQRIELTSLANLSNNPDLKTDVPQDGMALAAVEGQMQPTYVLRRGNPRTPDKKVTPGFPKVISPNELPANIAKPRMQLAAWIGSADNPLTARVMANIINMDSHVSPSHVAYRPDTLVDHGGLGR